MSTEEAPKTAKQTQEDLAVISNRIAVAFAKRESLIKFWTASSSHAAAQPTKSEKELEAEEEALFRNEPPYLGVGAPIPSHCIIAEAGLSKKSLREKFFPTKGLKASKARDAEEKAASAKRALKQESSDEEEGRSGLGRAKKLKMAKKSPAPKTIGTEPDSEPESRATFSKPKMANKVSTPKIIATEPKSESKKQSTSSKLKKAKTFTSETPKNMELDGPGAVADIKAVGTMDSEFDAKKDKIVNPAEAKALLKRLKKREKKRRKKLRDAQMVNKA